MRSSTDVRSFPGSRRWPQFNQEPLAQALGRAGVEYRWTEKPGRTSSQQTSRFAAHGMDGRRVSIVCGPYREYEFAEGLDQLIELRPSARTAMMCSEGLWWQCHRRIVSDQMTVRGWNVEHIMPDGKLTAHRLPEFASVVDGRIVYDGGQPPLLK